MNLLLDEQLSPRLADDCAEQSGIYAVSVTRLGLSGAADHEVWRHALENDFVVVTTNARHFLRLLPQGIHPGLIVLRESSLSRAEQWRRLKLAIDYIQSQPNPERYMTNRVIEVISPVELLDHEIPAP